MARRLYLSLCTASVKIALYIDMQTNLNKVNKYLSNMSVAHHVIFSVIFPYSDTPGKPNF